jgi:hypothetical protein
MDECPIRLGSELAWYRLSWPRRRDSQRVCPECRRVISIDAEFIGPMQGGHVPLRHARLEG